MNIAVIASARHPIRRPFPGGLEAQTVQLAEGLRAHGHRVRLYAADGSDPALGVEPVLGEARRLEVSAAAADPSDVATGFLEAHHAYLSLMLRLRETDVDVVHNHSLHYLPVAMAPALDHPVVTTLHTPPTPWLESAVAAVPSATGRFVSVSHRNAAAWAHVVGDCAVIHNGIPVDRWPYREEPVAGRAVWVGRIVPEKGPHLAIDTARTAGLELVLAGPVSDRQYAEREVFPRLGPDARYAGHLDTDDLATLVGSASVMLVTPRWDEPYGRVVPESLATGTPVAAFARGAMTELVDEQVGALATGDDVAALADAARRAMRRDRRACRTHAQQHASIEAMVDRYERLFAEAGA